MHQYEGFLGREKGGRPTQPHLLSRPNSPVLVGVAVPVVGKTMDKEAIASNARARNFMLNWEIKCMFLTLGN
jgi:hypothetical protein